MASDKVVIRSGRVTRTGAGKIGGVSSTSATASRPARVKLAIVDADGTERTERLELNDTFVVGAETWRLADITHFTSGRWAAVAVPASPAAETEDSTAPDAGRQPKNDSEARQKITSKPHRWIQA